MLNSLTDMSDPSAVNTAYPSHKPRLNAANLAAMPDHVRRPGPAPSVGIVHIGIGAFHRAHQAVYTADAIAAQLGERSSGGNWGICGISLRRPDAPNALSAQDGLFTVATLDDEIRYRIVNTLRSAITATEQPQHAIGAIAAHNVHVLTLTVTEKGYTLDGAGQLDTSHIDVVHDLRGAPIPRSTIGWLVAGLDARRRNGAAPITIISCDNLANNGAKLRAAVATLAQHRDPRLARWIQDNVSFPNTMVDCIVPATDDATRAHVAAAIGCVDLACVQREPFSQWVIENNFVGPRPAWEAAGAAIVADVAPYQQLKLYGLNLPHSALSYLGVLSGLRYCREAVADQEISRFVDAMMIEEVAPALPHLNVRDYWHTARSRIGNPRIDHAVRQIGEDGSKKLAQRALPLLIANVRNGLPAGRLATVVHAWLQCCGRGMTKDPHSELLRRWHEARVPIDVLLDDPALFPAAFREDAVLRRLMRQPQPSLQRFTTAAPL